MKIQLPMDFEEKMKTLLGAEWEAFRRSYEDNRTFGLRRNPIKSEKEDFERKIPFTLEPVGWAKEGYYYKPEEEPGKHCYHEAGAYYIQEPSAMAVAEVLDARPGESICDLCAAPGGKSTQIAGKMGGQGLLVSNEIYPARAKILSQNIERMGVRNCVVLNETTGRMAERFADFFDRVLVDAPCSGEGMFRKEEEVRTEWSSQQVAVCADRQISILDDAAKILRGGGVLVYSTCTFSPEENEGVVSRFLKNHEEFGLLSCECPGIFGHGKNSWGCFPYQELGKTLRLWPHQLRGEGHFIAKFIKTAEQKQGKREQVASDKRKESRKEYQRFVEENIKDHLLVSDSQAFIFFGDELYAVPEKMLPLDGLRVVRAGLHLGTNKTKRFEPSHALAMALKPGDARASFELGGKAPAYFTGETIASDAAAKGWTLMTTGGFSAGWGKAQSGIIKNHYPKGLRRSLTV